MGIEREYDVVIVNFEHISHFFLLLLLLTLNKQMFAGKQISEDIVLFFLLVAFTLSLGNPLTPTSGGSFTTLTHAGITTTMLHHKRLYGGNLAMETSFHWLNCRFAFTKLNLV